MSLTVKELAELVQLLQHGTFQQHAKLANAASGTITVTPQNAQQLARYESLSCFCATCCSNLSVADRNTRCCCLCSMLEPMCQGVHRQRL